MNAPASEEAAACQNKYEEIMLSPDFETRIQQLPSSILVYISCCLRQRMTEILTANIFGMQRGEMHCTLLEQARNMLLMMTVSAGRCPTTELKGVVSECKNG
jgi:hypothetical protein